MLQGIYEALYFLESIQKSQDIIFPTGRFLWSIGTSHMACAFSTQTNPPPPPFKLCLTVPVYMRPVCLGETLARLKVEKQNLAGKHITYTDG